MTNLLHQLNQLFSNSTGASSEWIINSSGKYNMDFDGIIDFGEDSIFASQEILLTTCSYANLTYSDVTVCSVPRSDKKLINSTVGILSASASHIQSSCGGIFENTSQYILGFTVTSTSCKIPRIIKTSFEEIYRNNRLQIVNVCDHSFTKLTVNEFIMIDEPHMVVRFAHFTLSHNIMTFCNLILHRVFTLHPNQICSAIARSSWMSLNPMYESIPNQTVIQQGRRKKIGIFTVEITGNVDDFVIRYQVYFN